VYKVTPEAGKELVDLMQQYGEVMQKISILLRRNRLPSDIIFFDGEWEIAEQQVECESIAIAVDNLMANTEEG